MKTKIFILSLAVSFATLFVSCGCGDKISNVVEIDIANAKTVINSDLAFKSDTVKVLSVIPVEYSTTNAFYKGKLLLLSNGAKVIRGIEANSYLERLVKLSSSDFIFAENNHELIVIENGGKWACLKNLTIEAGMKK